MTGGKNTERRTQKSEGRGAKAQRHKDWGLGGRGQRPEVRGRRRMINDQAPMSNGKGERGIGKRSEVRGQRTERRMANGNAKEPRRQNPGVRRMVTDSECCVLRSTCFSSVSPWHR